MKPTGLFWMILNLHKAIVTWLQKVGKVSMVLLAPLLLFLDVSSVFFAFVFVCLSCFTSLFQSRAIGEVFSFGF